MKTRELGEFKGGLRSKNKFSFAISISANPWQAHAAAAGILARILLRWPARLLRDFCSLTANGCGEGSVGRGSSEAGLKVQTKLSTYAADAGRPP